MLDAFDEDVIAARAGVFLDDEQEPTPEERQRLDEAKKELIAEAVKPFFDPNNRIFIEDLRRSHEQIIDSTNPDTVLYSGFEADKQAEADRVIGSFRAFIEENLDEILALNLLYDTRYRDRALVLEKLKALYDTLSARHVTVQRLWDCYAIKRPGKVKGTQAKLADLVSLIRFEMGYGDTLTPFADRVYYNFQQWTLRRNAGPVHFTEEQMDWLRLVRDHIAASLSITPDDLELDPFDRRGGLGRFYEVFGDGYEALLQEMNIELVG